MDFFAQALRLTDQLASTVAELEMRCAKVFGRPTPSRDRVDMAIRKTWPNLVEDARSSRVSPAVDYVAGIYARLATEAGIPEPGQVADRTDIPWLEYYTAGCGDEPRCEDAWVIAEIFWGGYVHYLQITLGWLLMDAIRVQQNLPAITPAPETTDRFTDCLRWSGPDMFDAESLRALFYDYEKQVAS
jgi:hypothetical protein